MNREHAMFPELSSSRTDYLSIRDLTKRYGDMFALDHVSLDIAEGEFVTLLGPSGSGKTTLLMSIAGFVHPEEGSIKLSSQEITRLLPEKRNFGMVFQGYALFPHLTAAENVAFPLEVRGMARAETARKVAAALELVQLGGRAGNLPRQLSGGQQQRVALARALVFEPRLLLLDEPLSALDKALREDLQSELRSLNRKTGTTFIAVTHDQEEALSMSDRVAILREGRIEQIGRPSDLYERPETSFIAAFLGRANFLSGMVESQANGTLAYRAGQHLFRHTLSATENPPAGSVHLALRPAKIHVATDRTCVNQIDAVVTDASFGGDHWNLMTQSDLGALAVTLPSWRCAIDPRPGTTIPIGWDEDATVIVQPSPLRPPAM